MADLLELRKHGWFLSEQGIQDIKSGQKMDVRTFISKALNSDLCDIGAKWLPDDISKCKVDSLSEKGVLQIQKIRNISAPKCNEESQTAPRMLRLSLSDGHLTCNALEMENIDKLSLDTPPGTKVKLVSDKILLRQGLLLLDNSNIKVLGGHVESLVTKWKLAKSLATHSLQRNHQGGAPPWLPFGKRAANQVPGGAKSSRSGQAEPFKAMDKVNAVVNNKKEAREDGEFEQQRQANIAEIAKAKNDKAKTFGNTKQSVGGACEDVSMSKPLPPRAPGASRPPGGPLTSPPPYRGSRDETASNRPPRDDPLPYRSNRDDPMQYRGNRDDPMQYRGNRDDPMQYRGNRGDDSYRSGRDEGSAGAGAKPSAPATLFDYLETKMPVKSGQAQARHTPPPRTQTSSFCHDDYDFYPSSDDNDDSQRFPPLNTLYIRGGPPNRRGRGGRGRGRGRRAPRGTPRF